MLSILTIGDPHFKNDNAASTEMMTEQIKKLVVEKEIDAIVVMGDTLHRHEKIDLHPLRRAIKFFRELREVSSHLYVLVGNHDYPSNDTYMTDEHGLIFLEEWDKTTLVDKAKILEVSGKNIKGKFLFTPYVPTGRLDEALSTVCEPPYEGISAIFAHQEFKGAKMNAITSNEGDHWKDEYPLCISGHIHDYDQLQENLIYVGTPIQHGYGDLSKKTISIFRYQEEKEKDTLKLLDHERVELHIPKKISLTMTPEELSLFEPPGNSEIKIKVKGDASVIKQVMGLPNVVKMTKNPNIKFVFIEIGKLSVEDISQLKIQPKISFEQRLRGHLEGEEDSVRGAFKYLFG